jgi:hypothetical protein
MEYRIYIYRMSGPKSKGDSDGNGVLNNKDMDGDGSGSPPRVGKWEGRIVGVVKYLGYVGTAIGVVLLTINQIPKLLNNAIEKQVCDKLPDDLQPYCSLILGVVLTGMSLMCCCSSSMLIMTRMMDSI